MKQLFENIEVTNSKGERETIILEDDNILAVIKFNGTRKEFNDFAIKVINQITHIPVDVNEKKLSLKEPFTTASMYVLGTVKGVDRNEIIFLKTPPITSNPQPIEKQKPINPMSKESDEREKKQKEEEARRKKQQEEDDERRRKQDQEALMLAASITASIAGAM